MLQMVLRLLVCLCLFLSATQITFADAEFVKRLDVQAFIDHMVKKYHFNHDQLTDILSQAKIRTQVIHHVSKPLEQQPWRLYQMLFVNEWRIQHGVEFWNKYESALNRAEKMYGVPANIIVATIGVETKYGERTGDFRVLDALTNLAFSTSKRAPFFRKELEEFFLLTREQHLNPLKIMGSYAGAIGQPQFMPSSYRHYAINFSKSGSIDLMNDEVDVIGSIANYYKKHGWVTNAPVATQAAILGDRFNYLLRNHKIKQPLTVSELARYGVISKTKIAQDHLHANVIELDSHYSKEYWLAFHNFKVIKRYNASDLYAMAVYQLSYYISALRTRLNNG